MKIRRQILLALFVGSFFGAWAQSAGAILHHAAAQAASWISLVGTASGTQTSTACNAGTCYNINNISVTDSTTTTGILSAFGVKHIFGGSGITGYVTGISSYFNMNSTTSNSSGNYVGNLSVSSASANDNGTNGSPAGSLWASNPNAFLSSGATNWLWLAGEEIDVTVGTGASVADKIGLVIVQGSSDAVGGSRSNIGIEIGNQAGDAGPGWDCGFCFGGYSGIPAINASGTLIGGWPHGDARNGSGSPIPTGSAGTVLYGIDLTNFTFSSGGSPLLAPLITPASSGATCKQGAIEWDASFIYICTATNTFKRATLATF